MLTHIALLVVVFIAIIKHADCLRYHKSNTLIYSDCSRYLCGMESKRSTAIHSLPTKNTECEEKNLKQHAVFSSKILKSFSIIGLSSLLLLKKPVLAEVDTVTTDIDLNLSEPKVTDICWLDLQVGSDSIERIEISLYGEVVPRTVRNFKTLCTNAGGQEGNHFGYRGSEIFRIINTFSVQGGNIGSRTDSPLTKSRFGRSAIAFSDEDEGISANGFPLENFRILHSYKDAGVVSMMREQGTVRRKGSEEKQPLQDSRFFVTLSPLASWADGKYVAFGRVSKGFQALRQLQNLEVQAPANYPLTTVKIVDSGCYPDPTSP